MPKTKIINFEWFCDCNHLDITEFEKSKIQYILNDIKEAADAGYDTIIGIYLLDGFLIQEPSVFLPNMRHIRDEARKMGIKEIYLLSGQGESFKDLDFPTFYFDYNLRTTYNAYKHELDQLTHYNGDKDKFLFLGGAVARPNRIGLTSKYYDQGLLDSAEWTFFPPFSKEDNEWCRNHLSHYSDAEYETFLKNCTRSFDELYDNVQYYFGNYQSLGTDLFWYDILKKEFIKNFSYIDHAHFKNTSLSIISEGINFWTWSTNNFFVTEKFWRAVVNGHPFIFSGHPDQFRYIKQMGFRTFEKYMLIKDYATFKDEADRIDAIVKNTEYWLTTHKQFAEQIEKDVLFNKNIMMKHVAIQNNRLNSFVETLGVDQSDIDHYLDRKGYEQLIRIPPDGF
jgi:hypothetical protein